MIRIDLIHFHAANDADIFDADLAEYDSDNELQDAMDDPDLPVSIFNDFYSNFGGDFFVLKERRKIFYNQNSLFDYEYRIVFENLNMLIL